MDKLRFENNPLLKHSFEFALMVINYCEELQRHKHFIVSNQMLRAGTSIGANVMEAQSPESKADFIHKMKIAAKEAEETQYWLLICSQVRFYPDCNKLFSKLEEIQKLLGKIISSAKRKKP
jgi:four helix bundle protein